MKPSAIGIRFPANFTSSHAVTYHQHSSLSDQASFGLLVSDL
jgi:hypothetical protein